MDLIWLLPLLPVMGAVVTVLPGVLPPGRRTAGMAACAAMALTFLLAAVAFAQLLGLPQGARVHDVVAWDWILPVAPGLAGGGRRLLHVAWAFRLDPLSALMTLVVTGIGLLAHVYATAYLADEPRGSAARCFALLGLLCAFMLTLVLAANYLVMFAGWEGVAVCSALLVACRYDSPRASAAALNALVTSHVADCVLLVGVLLVLATFGTLDCRDVASAAASMPVESASFGTLSLVTLLVFAGAAGRSAQIPFLAWLPDAMEGPAPATALIGTATTVTAGVYVVARSAALFSHAPLTMLVVALAGALTALLAASIGFAQANIERLLAWLAISQFGLVFVGMGAGAFATGVFHLVTTAVSMTLLFLCAGVVVRALAGERDVHRMGGLRRRLPVTWWTMLVGALAVAGIPPLSGFFSGQGILVAAFGANPLVWVVAALAALLSSACVFRAVALVFLREPRGAAPGSVSAAPGAREAPLAMILVPVVLAIGAAGAGLIGMGHVRGDGGWIGRFLRESVAAASFGSVRTELPGSTRVALAAFSVLAALAGIAVTSHLFVRRPDVVARLRARLAGPHRALAHECYVRELYGSTVVRGTLAAAARLSSLDRDTVDGVVDGSGWLAVLSSWIAALFDKYIVDGLVNLAGAVLQEASFVFRRFQTGLVQSYALVTLLGILVCISLYLLAR